MFATHVFIFNFSEAIMIEIILLIASWFLLSFFSQTALLALIATLLGILVHKHFKL